MTLRRSMHRDIEPPQAHSIASRVESAREARPGPTVPHRRAVPRFPAVRSTNTHTGDPMKRSNQLPDGFCFPTPPGRIDRTLERTPLLAPVAATYLTEIRRWRDTVAAALASDDPAIAGIDHLTPRARARLAVFLRAGWDAKTRHWANASGYGLTPFPAGSSRREDPMQAVLEALHWRSAVVQYLTEVWDVLGKPELGIGECAAIGMFMRPVRLEGRCVFCLTEFGPGRIAPDAHDCIMMRDVHTA